MQTKLLENNVDDLINLDLLDYYNSPGDYINLLNFSNKVGLDLKKSNLKEFLFFLIDNNYYKKDIYISYSIYRYIELYLSKLVNNKNTNKICNFYSYINKKISNMNKYNLDQESFFIEIKSKLFNE